MSGFLDKEVEGKPLWFLVHVFIVFLFFYCAVFFYEIC